MEKMSVRRTGRRAAPIVVVALLGAGSAGAQGRCLLAPCDGADEERRVRDDRRAALMVGDSAALAALGGRILGIVLDENGKPILGAAIVAKYADAVLPLLTVESDKKGRFGIPTARGGRWTLVVKKPGYSDVSGTLQVRRAPDVGGPVTLRLRKAPATSSALGESTALELQQALPGADRLYDDRRWDEAIAAYRSILSRAPALNAINLQIAAAYRSKGDDDAAIASYDGLLKIDPNNSRAKVGIAMVDVERGDLVAAERSRAYERASQLDPAWEQTGVGPGSARPEHRRHEGRGAIRRRAKV